MSALIVGCIVWSMKHCIFENSSNHFCSQTSPLLCHLQYEITQCVQGDFYEAQTFVIVYSQLPINLQILFL